MRPIFIETPVRVDFVGDARNPDGQDPAIVLIDAAGNVVARFPTPDAPGGRPALDAVMHAGAMDVRRQLNEIHEALVAESGTLPEGWTVGVEAVRFGDSVGDWKAAVSVRDAEGNEVKRVSTAVGVGNYDKLDEVARHVFSELRPVRKSQAR